MPENFLAPQTIRLLKFSKVNISKNRIKLVDKKSYACAKDIDSFGQKFFLDCVAQGVLDPWHIKKYLKLSLGEKKYDLVGLCMSAAFLGNGKKIINLLLPELADVEPDKKEKLVSVIKYMHSNLDWIANTTKVDCAGSGPIEKTVDITVARRFKKRGMSWYRGGANPLIKLRLLKLNGEWDKYWQEHKKEFARYAA